MGSIKYLVLWKKDNQTLSYYLDLHYKKLLRSLSELSSKILTKKINSLLKIDNRYFILDPNYSSLINYLYFEYIDNNPQNLWDREAILSVFEKELDMFLKWDFSSLSKNKWSKIWNTDIILSNYDLNPYNIQEAHPEHKLTWGILWWWEKSQKDWFRVYENTLEILKRADVGFYDEIKSIIKRIIPLWTSKNIHNSASYKECIWHLYMWYTINSDMPEINNLEAIIHESSHNKLNLVLQSDSILENDYSLRYYSSIRPDARHMHWVFLWYHAFAPTMYVIMKAYLNKDIKENNHILDKIVLYYIKTKFLQKVVKKHAILTSIWKDISDEIDEVIKMIDEMIKQINPPSQIIKNAKEKQRLHFAEVNTNYPYLEY